MSGAVAQRKRLLRVTAEDLAAGTLSLRGHDDFFTDDAPNAQAIELALEDFDAPRMTMLRRATRGGKLLSFAVDEPWPAEFFARHALSVGDVLALERFADARYRLYVFQSKAGRSHDWHALPPLPDDRTKPTVLELFAGCGGMMLGFHRAGFQTVLANEWDADACETIRMNLTDRVAQCAIEEIETFPKADVVAGGPPCQGFSNLGERVPHDPRRQMWRHFFRAVEQAEPRIFVMENVPPLLKSQEYVEILALAAHLGYRTLGGVLDSADFGAPQRRKRAILVGVRSDTNSSGEPFHPAPTHCDPRDAAALAAGRLHWRTVRDAIGDLPAEPTGENWHVGRNPTALSMKRYRTIPAGGNRWDLPRALSPACWIKKTTGGSDLFGRLWWDRPSVTIRTEFFKPEKGRYLHPEAHRPITPREAARLQGFPDEFRFHGSRSAVAAQIGNAVPPALATAIASACFVQLLEREK